MKAPLHFYIVLFFSLLSCKPTPQKQSAAPIHPTLIPVSSPEDRAALAGWLNGKNWRSQHEEIVQMEGRDSLELIFLGNSITQSWGGPGRNVSKTGQSIWDAYYSDRKAANFGISGDRTQHILWRIQEGALDGMNPKVLVCMIGTNNLAHDSASHIQQGIEAVYAAIREKLPNTYILQLGIFPREEEPDHPLRQKLNQINRGLAAIRWEGGAYMGLDSTFLHADGSLQKELYSQDGLHLAPGGYEAWAAAIEPVLQEMLGN